MVINVQFRPAQASDHEATVPLIYNSGAAASDYIFADQHHTSAETFLTYAFQEGSGEAGYKNHVVGTVDERVVCVGTGFTGETNLVFTLAAARQILSFYGIFSGWNVIRKGLLFEQIIQAPAKDVYYVAHLGVVPDLQGRGIGTQLIMHLLSPQLTRGCRIAALDVNINNPRAQALYECLGFTVTKLRTSKLSNPYGHVDDHRRMEKFLQK